MKKTDKFTFFWKTKDVFSNWHPSVFIIEGITFNCSEQYMMYKKAQLFNDQESIEKILAESNPKEQKSLGRKVKEFDSSIWLHNAIKIMEPGLKAKFEQNPTMLKELLDTGDTILAEASPSDLIWGIGLTEDDPLALDINNWKGKNMLGTVLMNVRQQIKAEMRIIQKPNITFEEFNKLDIRICKILSVEKVEKADKLYKLQIDTGFDKRTVVSAIAHIFDAESLDGSLMPFVLNLEPRKIRGIESHGMIILCETRVTKTLFPLGVANEEVIDLMEEDENDLIGSIII